MHTFQKLTKALVKGAFVTGLVAAGGSVYAGEGLNHDHGGGYNTQTFSHAHGNSTTTVDYEVTPAHNQTVTYNPPAAFYGDLPSGNSYFGNFLGTGGGYSYLRANFGTFQREVKRDAADGSEVSFLEDQSFIGGRFGHLFTRNLGIEARLAYSNDVEQVPESALTSPVSRFSVKNYTALMARYQMDLGNGLMPYFNLGIGATRSRFQSTFGTTTLDESETKVGAAGAIGLEFNFASNMVLGVDYHVMPESVKGLGFTVGYNF